MKLKTLLSSVIMTLAICSMMVLFTGCSDSTVDGESNETSMSAEHGHSHDGEHGEHGEHGSHENDGDSDKHDDGNGSHEGDGDGDSHNDKEGSGHDKDGEGHHADGDGKARDKD